MPSNKKIAEEFSAWDDIKFSLAIFAFWLFPIGLLIGLGLLLF